MVDLYASLVGVEDRAGGLELSRQYCVSRVRVIPVRKVESVVTRRPTQHSFKVIQVDPMPAPERAFMVDLIAIGIDRGRVGMHTCTPDFGRHAIGGRSLVRNTVPTRSRGWIFSLHRLDVPAGIGSCAVVSVDIGPVLPTPLVVELLLRVGRAALGIQGLHFRDTFLQAREPLRTVRPLHEVFPTQAHSRDRSRSGWRVCGAAPRLFGHNRHGGRHRRRLAQGYPCKQKQRHFH